jgi:hypothetical protein
MKRTPKELFEKHLSELVISAKLATEHRSILKCFGYKRYRQIVGKYYGYFYYSINGHKYGLVLALSQLYDTQVNTHNLTVLLDDAEKHGIIPKASIEKQHKRLARVKDIADSVLKLRHHRYAHKMLSLSESESNKRFSIHDKDVEKLIATACRIINDISQEYSRTIRASFSHGAKLELRFLLDDLRMYDKLLNTTAN